MKQFDNRYFVQVQYLLAQARAAVRVHIRQVKVKPAALAVTLFFGIVFMFAVKSDLLGKTPQTVMLPEVTVTPEMNADTDLSEETGHQRYATGVALEKMKPLPPQEIDTETLWLARCIYSETKRPQEQELVAWVVRNRVETGYRGNDSYQEAVLDPYQFSAFNPGTRTRAYYSKLIETSDAPGFQNALAIAKQVKLAPDSLRPFTETTRHFFSQQSMVGGRHPNWARGKQAVKPERPLRLEAKRFRFYNDVG